jgi:hypothetical protein
MLFKRDSCGRAFLCCWAKYACRASYRCHSSLYQATASVKLRPVTLDS